MNFSGTILILHKSKVQNVDQNSTDAHFWYSEIHADTISADLKKNK